MAHLRPTSVWHYLFSGAPDELSSPHVSRGMSQQAYVTWLLGGGAAEEAEVREKGNEAEAGGGGGGGAIELTAERATPKGLRCPRTRATWPRPGLGRWYRPASTSTTSGAASPPPRAAAALTAGRRWVPRRCFPGRSVFCRRPAPRFSRGTRLAGVRSYVTLRPALVAAGPVSCLPFWSEGSVVQRQ
ncbi:unnamed protein product [Ectocarpus fasciculatus]